MTKSDFSGFWVEEERKGDAIVNIGNVWRKGLLLGILLGIIGAAIMFKATVVETVDGDKIGKWAWKQIFFIISANLLFGVLLAGLPSFGVPAMGLIVAIYGLTFVASLAGNQFHFKEVFILATILAVGSYVAFIWGLALQFPVWPSFIVG